MNPLNLDEVCDYVNTNIVKLFHDKRIKVISELTLRQLLYKNPYLFRAKNITTASDLIGGTMEAFLSSSEEKLFGDFLEGLAIFIAGKTVNGRKSSAQGMDLEFTRDVDGKETYCVVSVKSGGSWGNSSQHKKLAQDFVDAVTRLRQSSHVMSALPVLGICYGKTKTAYVKKGGYLKLVGQNFWTFISDNTSLYKDIVEPIGYMAKEHNERYIQEKGRITNLLTLRFIKEYCDASGVIDWPRVVEANSKNFDLDKFFSKWP